MYKNPQQQHYGAGMLAALASFFTGGRRRRKTIRIRRGNFSLSPQDQQEVQAKAEAKRQRKLRRPNGYYNGNR